MATAPRTLAERAAAANRALADPARNRVIGAAGADEPRFELYHFALSLCSQEVRTALAEKEARWRSHDIDILPPRLENYHPDYVRLRLAGRDGRELVDGYSGRSATATEGFDPCVVPTLIDHRRERVLVDSAAIVEYLDREIDGGTSLFPARHRREIERQLAIVDAMPHVALLHGAHPDGDFRPRMLREKTPGAHDYKIMKLMEARALTVGQAELTAAYDAKIRKEAAARQFLRDAALMRGATEEIGASVAALEEQLADAREWVCGELFTAADVAWAASLFRLQWLGMCFAWRGGHALGAERPRVAAYARRLFAREPFRSAVVDWPGNPPSEPVAEHCDGAGAPEGPAREGARASGAAAAGSAVDALPGHGRDIREESLTDAVVATFAGARTPRAKAVLGAFARHLHAFIEEVEPSEAEWEHGIDFLTRVGQLSGDKRQEFVLLSDVMGATARVDLQTHRFPAGATANSVLGPFFVEERPRFANGADIAGGVPGEPLFASFRVLDTSGRAVAGAAVDVWHSDGDGHYDVMLPGRETSAMRGLFRSDRDGRVWFTTILPTAYPIPDDGPVGELLRAANRSEIRPAHLHVRIEAPGFRRLTTMLFVAGDRYLDADPVFGVKEALIVPFERRHGLRAPDGARLPDPCRHVGYDFVLASA